MKRFLLLFALFSTQTFADWASGPNSAAYWDKATCERNEITPCFSVPDGMDRSLTSVQGGALILDPAKVQAKVDADAALAAAAAAEKAKIDAIKAKLKLKAKLTDEETADLFAYLLAKLGETL